MTLSDRSYYARSWWYFYSRKQYSTRPNYYTQLSQLIMKKIFLFLLLLLFAVIPDIYATSLNPIPSSTPSLTPPSLNNVLKENEKKAKELQSYVR